MLLLAAGLALTAGAAPAQGTPQRAPGQTSLGALDTDRDGSISRSEAEALPSLSAQFPALDQNGNGALEPSEFARFEALGAESTPGNPPARLGTPPPMTSTPPPMTSTPPPMTSTPPPLGSTPPPNPATRPPQDTHPPPSP